MRNNKNNTCVYLHKKTNGEIFYVGIGKPERPFSKLYRNNHWVNIVNKYGYDIEVIFENLTWVRACELEVYYISLYGRKDLGKGTLINLTKGGDGQGEISEETRIKMSTSRKGTKWSEGQRNKMMGRRHSEETKVKMSQKRHSEERKKQISEASKKRWDKIRSNPSIMETWSKNKSSTCFKKGHTGWNKGTKGIVKSNSGTFKKGISANPDTQFKKGMQSWNKGTKGVVKANSGSFKRKDIFTPEILQAAI